MTDTDMVRQWTREDEENLARRVQARHSYLRGNPLDLRHEGGDHAIRIQEAIEPLIRQVLAIVGEDPERSGIRDTPHRVARSWANELLAGYRTDPREIVKTFDNEGYSQVVAVKDLPFYSLCEHHMLPFKGMAHIGYLPDGRVLGLSKFARIVDAVAARLQIQERMTKEIADILQEGLAPKGVMVVIEAEHLCMTMRGTKKPSSTMVTSMVTGVFEEDASTKDEFLRLIGR